MSTDDDCVIIQNAAPAGGRTLIVQTLRQDVAPGEPAALNAEIPVEVGRSLRTSIPHGAVIGVQWRRPHG